MQNKTYELTMDVKWGLQSEEKIELVTMDYGTNTFSVKFVDNGYVPYDLTGTEPRMVVKAPSGATVQSTMSLKNASSGIAVLALEQDMFSESGSHIAEFQIWDSSTLTLRLTTPTFFYRVRKSLQDDNTVAAQTEFSLLQDTLDRAEAALETATGFETPEGAQTKADEALAESKEWAKGTFSNPNMLINGDFQIWQRGTSFTIAEAGYTADRWRCSLPAGTTIEKSTDVPEGSPSGQSVKITLSESSSGSLRQYFEIPRAQLIGKTFTLSCWIKGPAGASASIDIADASTGAVALDGTWQKFIKTATLTSTSTSSLFVSVMRNGNTPGEYYVSDVKLECGSIATPFVPRLYGEELAACQRYLQVFDSYSLKTGSAYTSKAIYLVYPLFAAMRAKPSLANVPDTATINVRTVTGQYTFSVSSTDITVDRASDATAQIKITLPDNTDVTAGTPISAYFPSGAGVWLLDAEA